MSHPQSDLNKNIICGASGRRSSRYACARYPLSHKRSTRHTWAGGGNPLGGIGQRNIVRIVQPSPPATSDSPIFVLGISSPCAPHPRMNFCPPRYVRYTGKNRTYAEKRHTPTVPLTLSFATLTASVSSFFDIFPPLVGMRAKNPLF